MSNRNGETWWAPVPWGDVAPGDVVSYERRDGMTYDCPVAAIRPGHPSDRNRLGEIKVTLVGPDGWTFDRWVIPTEETRCRFPRHVEAVAS